MKNILSAVCAVAMLFLIAGNGFADDDKLHKDHKFFTRLSGYNEVHFSAGPPATLRGAVLTQASGSFYATLNKSGDSIDYVLSYKGIEGTVTQAHIHFGQRHTVGGIVVWLCETAGTPAPAAVAALTPNCPTEGTVTGSITAAQVLAQTAQGFAAGEFEKFVSALRAGAAYANVHSTLYPPGEIRGQVNSPHRHHRD
jgi:hypothetical protein